LCKQGLAIRGHTEDTGNFGNLLLLRAEDSQELNSWLARTGYRWTSPAIQNELIEDRRFCAVSDRIYSTLNISLL